MAPGTSNGQAATTPGAGSAFDAYSLQAERKRADLEALKGWMATQPHLPAIEDDMLMLFHHSCYYELPRTQDCIETYYTLRTSTPEFFDQRDLAKHDLSKALSALNFTTLPVADPEGNRIVYHGLREFEPSKYMFVDGIKLLIMTMDACLARHGAADGMVILFNMQGARLTHLTRVSLSPIRKFFQYIQDANPVRLKAIHVINVVPFIDKVMSLIKPFMKKELMNLLHFHGGDMDELHKIIPKHCLPSDFGGDLDAVETLCDKHNKTLESMADFFAREGKFRVVESKRPKSSKKGKKQEPADISFEKLEID